ncbi:hypothetical protein ACFOKI_06645 [Sphingomonas qilianensis]|uniref:hypothetical protein n=1 Tax=Sphingomonas qilianensis TaxID=1736690 RepID=UPI0036152A9F
MPSELDTTSPLLTAALASGRRAFLTEISLAANVPYISVERRLEGLPSASMPLLLGAAGWAIIARAIGINFAPTVH